MKVLLTSDWNMDAVNGVVTSVINLRICAGNWSAGDMRSGC